MKNTYNETREDLRYVADEFEDKHFAYSIYNNGVQYNVEDLNGIIHSFYPTTGTIVLHRSNDKKDHATKTIRDSDIATFEYYLRNPEKVQNFF